MRILAYLTTLGVAAYAIHLLRLKRDDNIGSTTAPPEDNLDD